jgi:hypothetical protein
MSEIRFRKFYGPNDLEKHSAFEQTGWRLKLRNAPFWVNKQRVVVKLFHKPARSDVDQALLKWLKQKRSGNIYQ